MAEPTLFGQTKHGEAVQRLTIKGGKLTAHLITWGAALQDLRFEGHDAPLVLGFPEFGSYEAASPYFGATVGRCANRIGHGRFELGGKTVQLDTNFRGRHHLHGGTVNAGKSNWRILDFGDDFASFAIESADGEMGYPGNAEMICHYEITQDDALIIRFEGEVDQPSLMNMAHHSYFNLADGGETAIDDHQLRIDAEHYLPVDDDLIPTGEIRPVINTDYDFRTLRPIFPNGERPSLFDHNFCLSEAVVEMREVVEVAAPATGMRMRVETDQPGVQFYAGVTLNPAPDGLLGTPYAPYRGFCLETQCWPDGINHEGFPSPVLQPGERYRHEVRYIFARD